MDDAKMAEVEALAGELGNVLEACRRLHVSRSAFYKWFQSKQSLNADSGVRPRRRHPHAVGEDLNAKLMELARSYPEWGCDRISHFLNLNGWKISPTSVQKFLTRNGLRTRREREGFKGGTT